MSTGSDSPDSLGPTVSVIGEAVLRAEPDEAILAITLTALQDTAGSAITDVTARGHALSRLLDDLAIASARRSTTGVSVREEFDHTKAGRRSVGHRASLGVTVRIDGLELIGRLVTESTTQLDAHVEGPRWEIAADNPVRLEAARRAAEEARLRARAFAEGVGARLGGLVALVEPGASPALGVRRARATAAAASEGMPVDSGEQEVIARIEATFLLVPADPTSSR